MNAFYGPVLPVPFETVAAWHPGFALAVLKGISVRPNERVMQAKFSSQAIGQPVRAAFDQQLTGYSIFAGADLTIDPTGAFNNNLFKTLSDGMQVLTTGMVMQLLMRTKDNLDYSPIPTDTPLQTVPRLLSRAIGIWHLDNPDQAQGSFTLNASPPGNGTFTVWLTFMFLVLGPDGDKYTRMDPVEARRQVLAIMRGNGGAPATP